MLASPSNISEHPHNNPAIPEHTTTACTTQDPATLFAPRYLPTSTSSTDCVTHMDVPTSPQSQPIFPSPPATNHRKAFHTVSSERPAHHLPGGAEGSCGPHQRAAKSEQVVHKIHSPVKCKSTAPSLLTPPRTRDIRMDGEHADEHAIGQAYDGSEVGDRLSDGCRCCAQADEEMMSKISVEHQVLKKVLFDRWAQRAADPNVEEAEDRRYENGPVPRGVDDIEDNPFLSQGSTSGTASTSIDDAYLSNGTALASSSRQQHPPIASGSSSVDSGSREPSPDLSAGPSTPRKRGRQSLSSSLEPTYERSRLQDVSTAQPIRDSPHNPFIEGGAADAGFHGPDPVRAVRRAAAAPRREKGKIAYVFRGQRVVYADSDHDSDGDSELEDGETERPPRFQPKYLFPPPRFCGPNPRPLAAMTSSPPLEQRASQSAHQLAENQNQLRRLQALERQAPEPMHPRERAQMEPQEALSRREDPRERVQVERQERWQQRDAERRSLLEKLDNADWSDDESEAEAEDAHAHANVEPRRLEVLQDDNEETEEDVMMGEAVPTAHAPFYQRSFAGLGPEHHSTMFPDRSRVVVEQEENPFLDSAPISSMPTTSNVGPVRGLFAQQQWQGQGRGQGAMGHQNGGNGRFAPYAPRGHAHGLAHRMHVPSGLRRMR